MTVFAGHYDEVLLSRASSEPNSLVRAMTGADVTIYESDGVTLATLYEDRDRAVPLDNPFAPGDDGNISFFAEPGNYVLEVEDGGEVVRSGDPIVVPPDPAEMATLVGTVTDGVYDIDIDITDDTKGVILTSPDATRWRITVSDAGQLTTTEVV